MRVCSCREVPPVPCIYDKADQAIDEWSGFAGLLANLIEKYASELAIENMPDRLAPCDRMGNAEVDQKDSDSK